MVIFEFLQDVVAALEYWLLEKQAFYDDPTDGIDLPAASAVAQIVQTIEQSAGVELQHPLGSGEHGLAFLASDNKVVKVIVDDPGEASAWHMLRGHKLRSLPQCYGAWRLASRAVESDLYAVIIEYIPDAIDHYCGELLRAVTKEALEGRRQDVLAGSKDSLARQFAAAFRRYASWDKRLGDLARLVEELSAKHGISLVDFSPSNVRQRDDGALVVIDLSVPRFSGTAAVPSNLVYERKLRFANLALPVVVVD